MRPVNKTEPPEEPLNEIFERNRKRGWSENRTLQGALADTIGHYCSFCELPINVGEHIEDIQTPRRGTLAGFNDWGYLLLSCNYCQTYRQNGTIKNLDDYVWPDVDDTFTLDNTSPFIYNYKDVNCLLKSTSGGQEKNITEKLVIVEPNSQSNLFQKAQNLVDLFHLNTSAYDPKTNTLSLSNHTLATYPDRRLFLRTEAWKLAQYTIEMITEAQNFQLSSAPYNLALKNATVIARTYGFWSVWMTAFWQKYKERDFVKKLFVVTEDKTGVVIHGYQGLPKSSPEPAPIERPSKVRKISETYSLFTGTRQDLSS